MLGFFVVFFLWRAGKKNLLFLFNWSCNHHLWQEHLRLEEMTWKMWALLNKSKKGFFFSPPPQLLPDNQCSLTHLTRWNTAGLLFLCLLSNMTARTEKQCINWYCRMVLILMVSSQDFLELKLFPTGKFADEGYNAALPPPHTSKCNVYLETILKENTHLRGRPSSSSLIQIQHCTSLVSVNVYRQLTNLWGCRVHALGNLHNWVWNKGSR